MEQTVARQIEIVRQLLKPGQKIVDEMSPLRADLIHCAMGISGEAGEIIDIVKKIAVYNQDVGPEHWDHLLEEIGDLFFYVFALMEKLNMDIGMVLRHNQDKLQKRYPNLSFTDEHAKLRLDKKEE